MRVNQASQFGGPEMGLIGPIVVQTVPSEGATDAPGAIEARDVIAKTLSAI
jgi:hypothetical protein